MTPQAKYTGSPIPVALITFVISAFALVWGLAPGLTWLDAGELMAASHELGVAHPPGFPLFAMMHKCVSMVIPMGDIALRGNLASAIIGSAGLSLIAYTSHLSGVSWFGSVGGALIVLISPIFVLHGTTVEVYTGLVLGLGLLCLFWVQSRTDDHLRWTFLTAFVVGLFVGGHHPEFRLIGLIFLMPMYLKRWKEPRCFIGCLFSGLTGTAIVAYLPVRASQTPWRNWGDPSQLQSLWDHFWALRIRTAYGDKMGQFDSTVLNQFAEQLTVPALILVTLGLAGLFRRRETSLARALTVVLIVDVVYSVFINPMGVRDLQNGIITACVLGWGSGACLDWTPKKLGRIGRPIVALTAVMVVVLVIFPRLIQSGDRGLPRLLEKINGYAPVESLALVASDHVAAGLAYTQVVEGARPDVAVVVRQHVRYASSVGPVHRRLPNALPRWQPGSKLKELAHLRGGWPLLWEWSLGLDASERPQDLVPHFPLFCRGVGCKARQFDGVLRQLEAGQMTGNSDEEWPLVLLGRADRRAFANLRTSLAQYHLSLNRGQLALDSLERAIELDPWNARRWNNLGVGFSSIGRLKDAIKATRTAIKIAPGDVLAQVNLGRYLLLSGQAESARQHLLHLVESHESATAFALLGVIAGNENGLERAREYFKRALAIDPNQVEARAGMKTLKSTKPPRR